MEVLKSSDLKKHISRNPDELLRVVRLLRTDIRTNHPVQYLDKKYKKLKEAYPSLYKIVIEKEPCSMEILEKMISCMKLIKQGEKSQEDMDKEIGYCLAKEYVYPNIDMNKEQEPLLSDEKEREIDQEPHVAEHEDTEDYD